MPPRERTPTYLDNHEDVEPEPRSPEDLIHEIAFLLQCRRDNVTFVQLALVRLSLFIPQYKSELMTEGVVREAITALRRHTQKDSLVKIVFEFLMTLLHDVSSQTYGESSAHVIENGGVEATLDAMRLHYGCETIQELGYYLLCNYSTSREGGMRLFRKDGFHMVVQAMVSSDETNLTFQQTGCAAITHLLHHDRTGAHKEVLVDLGVVPLIVENIKCHSCSQDGTALLLLCACGALGMLAENRNCVKTTVAGLNALPAILNVLSHSSSQYGTQVPCSVLVAICHLITRHNGLKEAFVDANGISLVKSIMAKHESDTNVISAACLVFSALTLNSTIELVDSVLTEGVLWAIVSAVARHADNERILFNSFLIIGSCARHCSFGMTWAIRQIPHILDVAVTLSRRHPEDERLQEVACGAIGHLSHEKVGLGKDALLDGLTVIIAATQQFQDNGVIPFTLCNTAMSLANYENIAIEIKSSGIVSTFIGLLRLHPMDAQIILQALEVLIVMYSIGIEIDEDIVEADGIPLLASLRSSCGERTISEKAKCLIDFLSESTDEEIRNAAKSALYDT